MSVHKPKLKNVAPQTVAEFIQHHIPYEVWMMDQCLKAAIAGAPTRVRQNQNVECLALHCRNLIEFFKNSDSCGFDPSDFTENFTTEPRFIREGLVTMIQQQIAHLTTGRTRDGGKKFDRPDWQETVDLIHAELDRWVRHLGPDWGRKWANRERMEEQQLTFQSDFGGASSSPTVHIQQFQSHTTTFTPLRIVDLNSEEK
jgi:hypothetical protein